MTLVLNISASPFISVLCRHTCMWLDITGLRFVLSQSVKHFILSRYTLNLVCIPISVFSTLAFYRPHNNSISPLVSVLQNQFGRIYVLLTCKTFLARFVSFAALSWVYASQIVWNLTKNKKTNKKQTNKTKQNQKRLEWTSNLEDS